MPHTLDAVVYDPATGIVQMLVMPDDDSDLDDPAFNPPGMVQVRVPVTASGLTYDPSIAPANAVTALVSAAQALTPGIVLVTDTTGA